MTDKNSAPQPVAWLSEYDGHTAVTTERDMMCQWRDTLGRKITPLYAAPISEGDRAARCKADFYALWCDSCNCHPSDCPNKQPASPPEGKRCGPDISNADAWDVFAHARDAVLRRGGSQKQGELAGLHAAIIAAYDVMTPSQRPSTDRRK